MIQPPAISFLGTKMDGDANATFWFSSRISIHAQLYSLELLIFVQFYSKTSFKKKKTYFLKFIP